MATESTAMMLIVGLMVSSLSDAQLLTENQDSALRGAVSVGSEWTPAVSAEGEQLISPKMEKEFLIEVESALGTDFLDSSKDRIADITKALRTTFDSVKKNEYGKLGHVAVRYVLHRLFVARHGWLMKGLDPAGEQFNSSSPVHVLKGKTSIQVQGLFEERLAAQGFGLQELAVFAALLESLISEETSQKLHKLWRMLRIPKTSQLTEKETINVIELYMTDYILGNQLQRKTMRELIRLRNQMSEVYSFWNETQKLVRQVSKEVLGSGEDFGQANVGEASRANVTRVLVLIGERFGKWQNAECQLMKQRLVDLEMDEKGCVPLSNFYKGMLHSGGSDWQFGESLDYLKTNGIIDEHDPRDMKVMIANYMNGPANCIATSHYYAVCCIDECESLIGHLEGRVSGPIAAPDELAALVAALPSSTVAANRTLPPSQMHRLEKIAEKHDGYVPLHGRLFMQWMHMVYPRECAYPHVAGTTMPLTPDAWLETTDRDTSATDEEMRRFVDAGMHKSVQNGQGQCGQWIDEEELYIGGQITQRRTLHELETDAQTWVAASSVALLCLLAATTLAVMQAAKNLKNKLCPSMAWMQERPLMYV